MGIVQFVPPTVILTLCFSFLSGRRSQTKLAYVILRSDGICRFGIKRMVSVPAMVLGLNPCESRPNSLSNPQSHMSLVSGIMISLSMLILCPCWS